MQASVKSPALYHQPPLSALTSVRLIRLGDTSSASQESFAIQVRDVRAWTWTIKRSLPAIQHLSTLLPGSDPSEFTTSQLARMSSSSSVSAKLLTLRRRSSLILLGSAGLPTPQAMEEEIEYLLDRITRQRRFEEPLIRAWFEKSWKLEEILLVAASKGSTSEMRRGRDSRPSATVGHSRKVSWLDERETEQGDLLSTRDGSTTPTPSVSTYADPFPLTPPSTPNSDHLRLRRTSTNSLVSNSSSIRRHSIALSSLRHSTCLPPLTPPPTVPLPPLPPRNLPPLPAHPPPNFTRYSLRSSNSLRRLSQANHPPSAPPTDPLPLPPPTSSHQQPTNAALVSPPPKSVSLLDLFSPAIPARTSSRRPSSLARPATSVAPELPQHPPPLPPIPARSNRNRLSFIPSMSRSSSLFRTISTEAGHLDDDISTHWEADFLVRRMNFPMPPGVSLPARSKAAFSPSPSKPSYRVETGDRPPSPPPSPARSTDRLKPSNSALLRSKLTGPPSPRSARTSASQQEIGDVVSRRGSMFGESLLPVFEWEVGGEAVTDGMLVQSRNWEEENKFGSFATIR